MPLSSRVRKSRGSVVSRRSAPSPKRKPKTAPKRASCFVYVVGTLTPRGPLTYVGWTVDLAQRLAAHNGKGGARFTKGRRWQLLYAEALPDRRKAMSREWHLKRDRQLRNALRLILKPT